MLSDIHFDPFHDPAKFDRLRAEPVTAWRKVLSEPDAPTQEKDLAKIVKGCPVRGIDTPWTLLESSLAAAHAHSPHALFVTVSGDLLVHKFDCRFHLLVHDATDAEYSAFTAKTLAYVASELHRTFGATPVYLALGNNDSGCSDYHEDENSAFLHSAAESFGEDVQSPAGRKDVLKVFPVSGNYSVALPKPIVRGRLIVLQDLFLSRDYAGCNGKPDAAAGAAELDWLRSELTSAHTRHEQVWVMAHIPPGVNVYSTMTTHRNVCGGQAPVSFLADEKLVEVLTDFAPDIRLAIFAHTHSDEMRLLQGAATPAGARKPPAVAAKLVPAVSPINGNNPGFTVAEVDPRTATLRDYRVIGSDNQMGINAKWTEQYRFSTTYHKPAYSAETVASLIAGFSADKEIRSPESQAYTQHFLLGGGLKAMALQLVWPQYACSLANNTEAGYRACACPAKP
jgi:sphingomyelin phosphodiesterase acid-like 3